jgi:hypothetical protein
MSTDWLSIASRTFQACCLGFGLPFVRGGEFVLPLFLLMFGHLFIL